MLESFAYYRNAREHIRAFAGEGDCLIDRHNEAMECRDCEAFLQMGIDAFNWLVKADLVLRKAAADGDFSYTQDVDEKLKHLAKWWLRPTKVAEEWIKVQQQRGYSLENLQEFRKCCEEIRAIVAFNELEGEELPATLIPLRDSAIAEQLNGETAEFLS